LSGLQIGKYPRDSSRTRIAAVSKIEHEAGVAHHVTTETSGGDATLAQKLFDFPE
jgi:hypothetical protein